MSELKDGLITTYNLDPVEFFGQIYDGKELIGGDAATNAQIIRDILGGKTGACRDIVILKAALAIVAGEKAKPLRDGIAVAQACIGSIDALKKLEALIGMTQG